MTTQQTQKQEGRGRPRHKVTIPKSGKFTIKSIAVFNKGVQKPVIKNRLRELLAAEKVRIVGKIEKKIKSRGRKSYVFEVVNN